MVEFKCEYYQSLSQKNLFHQIVFAKIRQLAMNPFMKDYLISLKISALSNATDKQAHIKHKCLSE